MKDKSKISWTDYTWNIAIGCTKVDDDCKYCYMYRDYESSLKYTIDNIIKTIERDKRENQSQWQSNYFEPFFNEFCKPKQLSLF